ncbi:MAG: hypothetical protein M3Q08_00760 [Pseudomonadota bacterium]|nr:hypothetical protein [Pseudomonadota bacterium]
MTTNRKPPDGPSELQIALDNRAFEIQLFWQRSNYFLVLMTALGVGVFTIKDSFFAFLISVFASVSSFYWYRTNLGSKFWQESWEVEVIELARQMKIKSFERPTEEIVQQVETSLGIGWSPAGKSWIRKYIDKQVIKKHSVSYYMIILSLTSTVLWSVVSLAYGVALAKTVLAAETKVRATQGPPSANGPKSREASEEAPKAASQPSESQPVIHRTPSPNPLAKPPQSGDHQLLILRKGRRAPQRLPGCLSGP